MRRVSVVVPHDRAEQARAVVLGLFPEGFEEVERPVGIELAVYPDCIHGFLRFPMALAERARERITAFLDRCL